MLSIHRTSASRPVRGAGLLLLGFVGLAAAGLPAPAGAGPAPDSIGQVADGVVDQATEVARSLSGGVEPNRPAQAGQELKGLFRIVAANCGGGAVSGTYFRMIRPGGSENGPFINNNDSTCADKTYTDLAPGRDGGLSTVDYQPHPDPPFDPVSGEGTNDRITVPKGFFGAKFSTATNATDPQTGGKTVVPKIVNAGGKLSGNLNAFAAAYQRQHFNQGSPKPDGSQPGLTTGPTGTYDPATKNFTIEWRSTIVGGPFNNFTGQWHFEGTFEPAAGGPGSDSPAPQPSPPDEGSPLPLPLPLPSVAPATGGGPAAPAVAEGARSAAAIAPAPARLAGQVAAGELKGLFRITVAQCATKGQESGSYFRMIQVGGKADTGPFISNTDTTCADETFTDLSPGKDGGLSTAAYQPHPDPPFDSGGNGLNDRITMPKGFFGTKFSTATNELDPQTNTKTTVPVIKVDASGKLSGDLRAFAAAWQTQHFNQGSPKPDGSTPGLTSLPTGALDPTTRKFTIEWTTTIKSDTGMSPFENFTGRWHFEGTFEGALPAATPSTPTGGTTTSPAPWSGTVAGTQVGAPTPRTGPAWPVGLPVSLLGLALLGRWASRRARPPADAEG